MNYYEEIKNKLLDNEIYSKIKDYSKERNKVITYFETGKILEKNLVAISLTLDDGLRLKKSKKY